MVKSKTLIQMPWGITEADVEELDADHVKLTYEKLQITKGKWGVEDRKMVKVSSIRHKKDVKIIK